MKDMIKKIFGIGLLAASLAGCNSYEQHKGPYRSLVVCKSKQTGEYKPTAHGGGCPRTHIKEMYFDLDDNPYTIEQKVQLEFPKIKIICNKIAPGFKPKWGAQSHKPETMTPKEQESINKIYQELKKWYLVDKEL